MKVWKRLLVSGVIGFIIGLIFGLFLLVLTGPPVLILFYYIFLGPVYDVMLPASYLSEGLGYYFFIFSAIIGAIYGVIISWIYTKFKLRKILKYFVH